MDDFYSNFRGIWKKVCLLREKQILVFANWKFNLSSKFKVYKDLKWQVN